MGIRSGDLGMICKVFKHQYGMSNQIERHQWTRAQKIPCCARGQPIIVRLWEAWRMSEGSGSHLGGI